MAKYKESGELLLFNISTQRIEDDNNWWVWRIKQYMLYMLYVKEYKANNLISFLKQKSQNNHKTNLQNQS